MRLAEELSRLKTRAEKASELLTEEATKNALVMPTLLALGYDVFDPEVVVPEFTADVGIKKGEKVDYAIRIGGKIALLVECKPVASDLSKEHASQLYRYFSVTEARFSVLTNGIEWRFFTDLDAPNKMDAKPFFIFSLLESAEHDLIELAKFAAESFSVDDILSAASDLKYKSLIADEVRREFSQPSDEFTRMIARRIYDGNLTAEIRGRFSGLIASTILDILRDQANQRLKDAIDRPALPVPPPGRLVEGAPLPESTSPGDAIKTTEEEIDGLRIIKAIVRKEINVSRVYLRDAASYCAILFDDNNRRPIARLYLEGKKKRIGVFADKIENRFDIESVDDIYNYSDQLLLTVRSYLSSDSTTKPNPKRADAPNGV